jgi:peptide/nickel transport system ATP-binding protein
VTLLEIEDLHVTYRGGDGADGDVPAVRGADLRLDAGEVVGLAGESGCGKSTLASTVLRLQPSTARVSGRVLLDGEDVLTMRWGALRAVRWAAASMVFQGALHALNPLQRVGDQIAEPMLLHERTVSRPRTAGPASCSNGSGCRRAGRRRTRTSSQAASGSG